MPTTLAGSIEKWIRPLSLRICGRVPQKIALIKLHPQTECEVFSQSRCQNVVLFDAVIFHDSSLEIPFFWTE